LERDGAPDKELLAEKNRELELKLKVQDKLIEAFTQSYEDIKKATREYKENLIAREREAREHMARLRAMEEAEAAAQKHDEL